MGTSACYAEQKPVQIHFVSQSPHTFAYKVWVGRPNDPDWQLLDQGDITTPPKAFGPFPSGTKLDYCLLIHGSPKADWQVQLMLSQDGVLLACSPPAERGQTDDKSTADRETVVTLA